MNKHKPAKKILVIRNDKIGDFMLAWPSFALLKSQYPETEISALVPQYTAPLAEQCEWIDTVLIDDKKPSFFSDILNLSKNIKQHNYDLSISLFSETRTSLSLWIAGIKLRIGPATKIAQIFLNNTLRQKRSRSLKPEYGYNLDLIKHYIKHNNDNPVILPRAPYLHFDKNEISQLRNQIKDSNGIPDDQKIIIIHPGTGGSAINLSNEQYAELIQLLSEQSKSYFIITAGPGELSHAKALSSLIKDASHHIHESTTGIINFCKFINICDLFISGSTGPLHIAGALNVNTASFYPARKSATALRWQTINEENRRLHFSPEEFTGNDDMKQIDISLSATEITQRFLL
ncbi:MAG: glycosyltransferase family 9 protein [Gammaproteobacteria bacterium]|nr:MAG: glycosyltransferase family 9 protein [Gammaproteobacteria bacterium]